MTEEEAIAKADYQLTKIIGKYSPTDMEHPRLLALRLLRDRKREMVNVKIKEVSLLER